jgi:hypothetical protein
MVRAYDDDDLDVDRGSRRSGGSSAAASRLAGPAIALMVVASLHLVLACIGLPFSIYEMTQAGGPRPGPFGDAGGNPVANIIGGVIAMAIQAFILFGAFQMKSASNYGVSMAVAILSLIPCCSSCLILGIPFGIWALIVLMDPEVKSAFRS